MGNQTKTRLLVIPHVGTALGHLIRTGEVLNTLYGDVPDIFVCIPESAINSAKRHMPARVQFLTYPIRPTVTGRSGRLDEQGFLNLLRLDFEFFKKVRPNLILGDPGIRTGLLGERVGAQWAALMHGCYLPRPHQLKDSCLVSENVKSLSELAWIVATKLLDHLVQLGSRHKIGSWAELRSRGNVLIPNTPDAEPSEIGHHIGSCLPKIGFVKGAHAKCVMTLCSSGDTQIPRQVLEHLIAKFGKLSIVGVSTGVQRCNGVEFLDTQYRLDSVVGPETTVICHGGHGSLKAVRNAHRVIIVPGDLDQLCNALTAHVQWGAELAIGDTWSRRLLSVQPLHRFTEWDDLYGKLS